MNTDSASTHEGPPVGLLIGSAIAPEQISPLARLAEELGYSELWLAEDYFFTGGVAGVSLALAATEKIPVGFGILSAVVRHPAVTAMEIATLARAFPGRVRVGFGLGVPFWLGQMGLKPKSQLGAVRECVTAVRRLLEGEELSAEGDAFTFDKVKLTHPPAERLPIYLGVMGPKMCQLCGELGDGLIVGATASTKYVAWARERVAEGAAAAGRNADSHRFPCFLISCVERDAKKARDTVRPVLAFYLSIVGRSAYTDVLGISEAFEEMVARGGHETLAREMPDEWIDELSISGDPDDAAERIERWLAGGADSVVLFPMPFEKGEDVVRLVAKETFPRLKATAQS